MKKSVTEDVVHIARAKAQEQLDAMRAYLAPTGTKTDQRTIDRRITRMTPEQMAQLAQSDPAAAESAAARLKVLQDRAAALPPLPAQDEYEPQ